MEASGFAGGDSLASVGHVPHRRLVDGANWPSRGKSEINLPDSDALDTRGTHAVTISEIPCLEWYQVHLNGKSRVERL